MCIQNFLLLLGTFLFESREFRNVTLVENFIQTHKNCLLFDRNSLKVLILFDMNSEKISIGKTAQPAFTSSKLTIETLKQYVKYVQSEQ